MKLQFALYLTFIVAFLIYAFVVGGLAR